jgi:hypothetical protein
MFPKPKFDAGAWRLGLLALACSTPCTVMALAEAAPVTAAPSASASAGASAGASASAVAGRKSAPNRQQKQSSKAKNYYISAWGVDKMKVSYTASGNLIRFSYRVSNPERAKTLGEKQYTPYMVSPRANAVLQVPVMDKVGILRQAVAPQAGQEYWMVFSNKGNLVKPGDRVNVVIGAFHADGLMVE